MEGQPASLAVTWQGLNDSQMDLEQLAKERSDDVAISVASQQVFPTSHAQFTMPGLNNLCFGYSRLGAMSGRGVV
eukprot:7825391-Heterocapsa_arctica.AAC.1